MKRIAYILSLFLLIIGFNHSLSAQDGYDKIRPIQISFFTEKMDLTVEQSKQFWPIHDQYSAEKRAIWKEIKRIKQTGNPNELKKLDALEEKKLDLRNQYKGKFLKVISTKQLSKMYQAEEEWLKIILERKNKD